MSESVTELVFANLTLILLTGENGQLFEVLVTSGGGAGKMKVLIVELIHL